MDDRPIPTAEEIRTENAELKRRFVRVLAIMIPVVLLTWGLFELIARFASVARADMASTILLLTYVRDFALAFATGWMIQPIDTSRISLKGRILAAPSAIHGLITAATLNISGLTHDPRLDMDSIRIVGACVIVGAVAGYVVRRYVWRRS
jgi:hypothetical protein